MNPRSALIILLLVSLQTFAQKKKGKISYTIPTESDVATAEDNYKCVFRNTYSPEQRRQFYPFNRASKILLISYNDPDAFENTTPVEDKKLDLTKVREIVILNPPQVDSLTSILYNIEVKSTDYWFQIANLGRKCYNPRNSIIFFDEKQRAFEFIEICFQCYQNRLSSTKIMNWRPCETKFDLLQEYFLSTGIKIGTEKQTD